MIRLIAVALFSLSVTASAQAMTPAPIALPAPDDMITQVAVGCGPGRPGVDGVSWRDDRPPEQPSRSPPLRAMEGKHLRTVSVKPQKWRLDHRPDAIELADTAAASSRSNGGTEGVVKRP